MTELLPVGLEATAALAEVHAAAFDKPWSAKDLAALMESPGVGAVAAGSDAGFDGFVLVRSVAGEAEVLTLAVRPDARRAGIGLALTEAGAGIAAATGAEVLWLEVAADNDAAISLYRRAGFEAAGRRAGYYQRAAGPAVDAIVLRRVLNSGAS